MKLHRRSSMWSAGVLAVMAAVGVLLAQESRSVAQKPAADNPHAEDEAAIRQQAADFATAFARGDAPAIAASWTDKAEYMEETGVELHGRKAIEQAFAEFFEDHPGARISFAIESIRFPASDLAIEEGTSSLVHGGAELPASSRYFAIHVRQGGEWKTAISREWGAEEDRLEDLDWLIGDWDAETPEGRTHLGFAWNAAHTVIEGTFKTEADGQTTSSGRQHIIRDPRTGELNSWIIDDQGGRGEAAWVRDGNRWLLETNSVESDGITTSSTNVLTRLNDHEIMWRSVHRMADDVELPDTDPVKLARAKTAP
jgi:uncharacterized protein (TIGR02246 family)